jgi:FtsP/CotA-like multicopper oxidase with cupredoxin domain
LHLAGGIVVAMLVGVATIAAILPRVPSSSSDTVREIRLVAHDMTYYLEGSAEPNPTLRVRRGQRVRIVLQNADKGMSHDLAILAWKAATRRIDGPGEASIEFRAPEISAQETYACNPHGQTMRGTIRVE